MKKQDSLTEALVNTLMFDDEAAQLSEEWAGFVSLSSKQMTKSEKKNFINKRSVVMDLHSLFEVVTNLILADYFSSEHSRDNFKEELLPLIPFKEKLTIIRKLKLVKLTGADNKLIVAINKIRNTFAHGYHIDNKRFNYKNDDSKHIVTKKGVINEFEKDAVKIIKHFLQERKQLLKKINERQLQSQSFVERLSKRAIK